MGIGYQELDIDGELAWDEPQMAVERWPSDAITPQLFSLSAHRIAVAYFDWWQRDLNVKIYRDCGQNVELLNSPGGTHLLTGNEAVFSDFASTADGNGGMITAYIYYDLDSETIQFRAQKLDGSGRLLWEESGIPVANRLEDRVHLEVLPDFNGGAYVIWEDFIQFLRVGYISCQRISSDGERLWGVDGVRIDLDDREANSPIFAADDSGVYLMWREPLTNQRPYRNRLRMQRLNPEGQLPWGAEGVILTEGEFGSSEYVLVPHPVGVMAGWTQSWDEAEEDLEDIRVQLVNQDGEFQWVANGAIVKEGIGSRYTLKGALDDQDNVWLTWCDDTVNNHREDFKLFTQKIDPAEVIEGSPRMCFAPGGVAVTADSPTEQSEQWMAPDGAGGMWLTWTQHEEIGENDIYAIHLTPGGEPYSNEQRNGLPVSDVIMLQHESQCVSLTGWGGTGIAVIWRDTRSSGNLDTEHSGVYCENLYLQRVDDGAIQSIPIDNSSQPVDFAIERVYPNPFNGRIRLDFRMNIPSLVNLKVFDMQGRLCWANTHRHYSTGNHSLTINGDGLASGVYLFRLETGFDSRMTKAVLVK